MKPIEVGMSVYLARLKFPMETAKTRIADLRHKWRNLLIIVRIICYGKIDCFFERARSFRMSNRNREVQQ